MSVYKKFTAQDKAIIPFNAHKQYNFNSSSAATNQVTHYTAKHTSESISLYSSASSVYGGDSKNVIKYNQIDHLFYRDYLKKLDSKKDFTNPLKQRRDLYEKVNILSIPSGLYGFEIKPSSFYLSSSGHKVTDDSLGNLIISGTNLSDYPSDVQENVFRLDPIKGFKKYDLTVYDGYAEITFGDNIEGQHQESFKRFYRKGLHRTDASSSYSTKIDPTKKYIFKDEDDSYFFNEIKYNSVTFNTSSLGNISDKFPAIHFNSLTGSHIEVPHDEKFNFNSDQNFAISFYINPQKFNNQDIDSEKRYIIAKSGTKNIIDSGSNLAYRDSEPQFPFEIYMQSESLYFERSDGDTKISINNPVTSSAEGILRTSHVLCQNSSSVMQIWVDGNLVKSTTTNFKKSTKNTANMYIGSKGKHNSNDDGGGIGTSGIGSSFIIGSYQVDTRDKGRFFNGDLSNINIWFRVYNSTQIANISESINASPYIGNIFYKSGFVTITHPNFTEILNNEGIGDMFIGDTFSVGPLGNSIEKLQFQGTHLIYEHEYQCTVQEHEFNATTNVSARKDRSRKNISLENFATGSLFKPYVTTIGLYNEKNELLVVGKLGQPIRMSDETDTTFIVRYDT